MKKTEKTKKNAWEEVMAKLQQCFDEADAKTEMMCGNIENPPDDEAELIFSIMDLDWDEQLRIVNEFRAKKAGFEKDNRRILVH